MISQLDSSFLRGLLRVYFVVAFILLGIIGSQACRCTVKVALQRGKSVKLNKMTGWISGPSLIKSIWQLRRLPGGVIFGLIMIVASIATLVADFATSTLVYQKSVYDRCHFDTGLVVDANVKWWDVPPPNSAAAIVASNAQILSELNGGYIGIYNKASFNVDFAAEEKDIMGWWTCTEEVGKDHTYSSLPVKGGLSDVDISVELYKEGLQWENCWMVRDLHDTQGTAHLIIWSTNVKDGEATPFEVKVSVDQGTTYGQDKTMKSYHCAVNKASYQLTEVNEILSSMLANTTMKEWVMGLPASIYNGLNSPPNTANTTSLLAQTLNTLTMVQGGFGSIISRPAEDADKTYGCLITKTYISIVVIALAGAVGFMLLSMTLFWILQCCRLGVHALPWRTKRTRRTALTPVPDGLVGWMLQATRESSFGQMERQYGRVNMEAGVPEDDKQTRQWRYVVVENEAGGRKEYARLMREGGSPPMVEQVPTPMYVETSYPPPPGQGVMWDPKGQGKYGLVPTDGR